MYIPMVCIPVLSEFQPPKLLLAQWGHIYFQTLKKIKCVFKNSLAQLRLKIRTRTSILYKTHDVNLVLQRLFANQVYHTCASIQYLLVKCWKPLRFEFQLPHSQLSTTLNTDQKLSLSQQVLIFWQLHAWRGIKKT